MKSFGKILWSKIAKFSENRVNGFGASLQLFVSFILLNQIPFFVWSKSHYLEIVTLLRVISGVFYIGLLFFHEEDKKNNRFFPLYWHMSLMICFPFTSITVMLLNDAATYWILNVVLSLSLLSLLVDWLSFTVIFIVSVLLSVILVKFIYPFNINISKENITLIIYMLVFIISHSVIFSRRKEELVRQKINSLTALAGSIAHEVRTPISGIRLSSNKMINYLDKLIEAYKIAITHGLAVPILNEYDFSLLEQAKKNTEIQIKQAFIIIEMLLMKLKDSNDNCELKNFSAVKIIKDALNRYPLESEQRKIIKLNISPDFNLKCNELLMSHVIFNLIKNSLYYIDVAAKGEIIITIMKTSDFNIINFKDTGKGIEASEIHNIFKKFYSKSHGGAGLGLAFCKIAVEEIGGTISCNSIYEEYTEFLLKFPND